MTKTNSTTLAIVNLIILLGGFAWINKTTGTYDPVKKIFRRNTTYRGASDIIGIYKGKYFECEVKTVYKKSKDKLSGYQILHQQNIESSGGKCFIVKDSTDFEEQFKKHFKK